MRDRQREVQSDMKHKNQETTIIIIMLLTLLDFTEDPYCPRDIVSFDQRILYIIIIHSLLRFSLGPALGHVLFYPLTVAIVNAINLFFLKYYCSTLQL